MPELGGCEGIAVTGSGDGMIAAEGRWR